MSLLKKAQISISFNTILSIIIGIIIFIIVLKLGNVFLSYSQEKNSYQATNYLELSLKDLYAESNYVKQIKLNQPTEFSFDSENLIIPKLRKTIAIGSNLIVAPSYMKTQSITLFNKRSKFPIQYVDYLYLFPSDYTLLIYNSSDPLAQLFFSELPDVSHNPLSNQKEVLINKRYVDNVNTIYQICGRKNLCYVVFFNSPSDYNSVESSPHKNIISVLVSGNKNFGNVTLSSKQNVTFFDKYTMISAIISNDLRNYNSLIDKIRNITNLNYHIESKRLSYLYDLEPSDECKDLVSEINDTLFNINFLILNLDFDPSQINSLNANISLLNQDYYLIKENDCNI